MGRKRTEPFMGGKRGTRVPRAQVGSGGHRCKDDQAQRSAHPQDPPACSPQTWLPPHAPPLAAFLAISSDHSPTPAKAHPRCGVGLGTGRLSWTSPLKLHSHRRGARGLTSGGGDFGAIPARREGRGGEAVGAPGISGHRAPLGHTLRAATDQTKLGAGERRGVSRRVKTPPPSPGTALSTLPLPAPPQPSQPLAPAT